MRENLYAHLPQHHVPKPCSVFYFGHICALSLCCSFEIKEVRRHSSTIYVCMYAWNDALAYTDLQMARLAAILV
jgi:hypothetical protein